MTKNEFIINDIITRTFKILKEIYTHRYEGCSSPQQFSSSRLIFPRLSPLHRNGKIRVSEQELRFAFVEQFSKYCTEHLLPWGYSVETPTVHRYSFSDVEEPRMVLSGGESGSIDLCIHDENLNRIALIEFKAHNPEINAFKKDSCKLHHEQPSSSFFVLLLEGCDEGTKKSVRVKTSFISKKTIFRCFSLITGTEVKL